MKEGRDEHWSISQPHFDHILPRLGSTACASARAAINDRVVVLGVKSEQQANPIGDDAGISLPIVVWGHHTPAGGNV
jgi:hypothetical protein